MLPFRQLLRSMNRRLLTGREAHISYTPQIKPPLERHGSNYGGWCIHKNSLTSSSIVYSFGLGEDISFDLSLNKRYGCQVHGFDPTPRAIEYVSRRKLSNLVLHAYGLAGKTGMMAFYLPANKRHVSGSIIQTPLLKSIGTPVLLKRLADIMLELKHAHVNLLKMDIEGAEYQVIQNIQEESLSEKIDQWLIEFHHRFDAAGPARTQQAINRLGEMGFVLAWVSERGDEFLFVRERALPLGPRISTTETAET